MVFYKQKICDLVTEQYRQAIDLYNEDPEIYEDEKFMLIDPIEEIQPDHRPFDEGFLYKRTVCKEVNHERIEEIKSTPKTVMKKPELLAPAGNLEKLKIAVHYGADAVFLGGQEYGLRSNADNFTMEEIAEGVEFANRYGAKIYVTTNIIAHDENIEGLESYLRNLEKTGATGIIVADPLIQT